MKVFDQLNPTCYRGFEDCTLVPYHDVISSYVLGGEGHLKTAT